MTARAAFRLCLLTVVATTVAPAAASAAGVSVSGATLTYLADPGERNALTVTVSGGTISLEDTGATISPGSCTSLGSDLVSCSSAGITSIVVDGRDRDDAVIVSGGIAVTLSGGSGSDTLTGGDGNDTLNGANGDDRLIGGPGADTMNGDDGDDSLTGRSGADVFNGGAGTDLADFSTRTAPVFVTLDGVANDGEGGEGDNVRTDVENVTGGSGRDVLSGIGAFNNVLSGGPADDELDGGGGGDTLLGGAGADRLVGGSGTDTADYSASTAAVSVTPDAVADDGESGEGDDVQPDVENATGGAGDDVLDGTSGANVLTGGAGDDTLDGALGADTLAGGEGVDTADYSARDTAVTVILDAGANDGGAGELDLVRNDVENILGGAGDDTLTGSGSANALTGGPGRDVLDGGLGADVITGGPGTDLVSFASRSLPVTVALDGVADDGEAGEADNVAGDVEDATGGSAADTLVGSAADNRLTGNAGNDLMIGGSGADAFAGGAGTDTVDYSARVAPLTVTMDGVADDGEAGEGDNVGADLEAVIGGSANDTLTGGAGADSLQGNGGDDVLSGGPGADVLGGGAGDDLVSYAERTAAVLASIDGAANDGASGEGDNVQGDVEDLRGGAGADTLTGSAQANDLSGGDGADTLDGGVGADVLAGGAGADTASYATRINPVDVSLNGAADDGEAGEGDLVGADVENITSGAGADVLAGDAGPNVLTSNDGADLLTGHGGDDRLLGGNDGDALDGGGGADVLDGGAANDTVTGGAGADRLGGGSGNDAADYGAESAPVVVSLDGAPNDGAVGEGDIVLTDVENVVGGAGDDQLSGDAAANVLSGGPGNDVLRGLAGEDTLLGAAGDDLLVGGSGLDAMLAADGDDTLRARDGIPDELECGLGDDTVTADEVESYLSGACAAVVTLPPAPGPASPQPPSLPRAPVPSPPAAAPPSAPPSSPALLLRPRVSAPRGTFTAAVACPAAAPAPCAGAVTATAKGLRGPVAKQRFMVAPGKSGTVRLTLTPAARAVLAKRRSLTLAVMASAGGWSARRSVTLTA